jgi:hypothetical protein
LVECVTGHLRIQPDGVAELAGRNTTVAACAVSHSTTHLLIHEHNNKTQYTTIQYNTIHNGAARKRGRPRNKQPIALQCCGFNMDKMLLSAHVADTLMERRGVQYHHVRFIVMRHHLFRLRNYFLIIMRAGQRQASVPTSFYYTLHNTLTQE